MSNCDRKQRFSPSFSCRGKSPLFKEGVSLYTLSQWIFISVLFFGIITGFGCSSTESTRSVKKALDIIADPRATTNELVRALLTLRDSKVTNEPPTFWSAIANSSEYSIDHRRRAVFQLLARHFHSGMTLGQIGVLLDHPTWLDDQRVNGTPSGAAFPDWDGMHELVSVAFLCDDRFCPIVVFEAKLGVKNMGTATDMYRCLEGNGSNLETAKAEIDRIVSLELVPQRGYVWNAWGIPP